MRKLIVVLLILTNFSLSAQTSEKYNSKYASFFKGEELFEKSQFSAARKEFNNFINLSGEINDPLYIKARYYEGLSALELYQNDGVKLLERFIFDYPETLYKNDIYFRLGQYYYQKKKYSEAIEWYAKLDINKFDPLERDEYYFKLGYSYFEEEMWTESRSAFYEAKDSPSQYGSPSLYYYSHLAYTLASYQTALDGFKVLQNNPEFEKVVPYYLAQIYYKQGRYEELVDSMSLEIEEVSVANGTNLNLIIGDAFFRLNRFEEALPYLERYNFKSRTTREDDYQLGFVYYKTGNYEKAIRSLGKTTLIEDSLSQIAYYQIGECYLRLENFTPARSAFESAANLSFDEEIEEDALYQFAVLSYKVDLNPYDEAVIALERYLETYPNSKRKNDIYQYLVNVYTTTNNYSKALASLDKLPRLDTRLKKAYQVVAFNAGVEQFQNNNYIEAIRLFGLVDRYPVDPLLTGKAAFWTGDTYYRQREYRRSIMAFDAFLKSTGIANQQLKSDAYYNIGYSYLKLSDTLQAIESLRLYTQQSYLPNKHKLADAYMRVGDGYYSTRQNEQAVAAYKSALALSSGYEDQAWFYLGKTYGYMNKIDEKIDAHMEILNKYPNSKYVQISVQEIAASFKGKGAYTEALIYYQKIIQDYPTATIVKNAMVEIADIYYKKQDYLKSEKQYKAVLDAHSGDRAVCESSAKGLVELYRTMREPERMQGIIERYPCANLSADEQEELFYLPAYELYKDSSFQQAIPQIQKYLDKFPSGKYGNEMLVFMGNCYYRLNDIPKAIEIYKTTLNGPNTGYTEFAAGRVATYLYNSEKYQEVIPYYLKLEEISVEPDVIYSARLGLMRSYFLVENFGPAAVYAEKTLGSSQINNTIKLEANYALGMAQYKQDKYAEAIAPLEWIFKNTTTVMGAEVKFILAQIAYNEMDYSASDKAVRDLVKMKPSYNYWVAKGLILQSRSTINQDDLFQAEQTLKSVRDHYPNSEDGIMEEANLLWDQLMTIKSAPKEIQLEPKPIIEVNGEK
ncbi:MAG: tetratricopeptide (TPR) repeat protein [Lentimonas sp.]|jgi:tetratricopeptide (TPR) repeat protein